MYYWKTQLEVIPFESFAFTSYVFSLLESALCLWIQGLKMLVLWTQKLTMLEDQGLWIEAIVIHCFCAKPASSGIRARFTFLYQVFKNVKRQVLFRSF